MLVRIRRDGFQRPWHNLQLSSWFVFSFLGLSFHFLMIPAFESWKHQLALSLTYWALAGPMVYYGYGMTASEPLDNYIIEARQIRIKNWRGTPPIPTIYDYPLENESEAMREERRCDPAIHAMVATGGPDSARNWCPYCVEHVHPTSKHCRSCNKCVSDFDHHCKWLNTCVGGKNYRLFFLAMSFALALLAYECSLALFLFISTFQDDYSGVSAVTHIQSSYGSFSTVAFQILMALTILFSAPLFISLFQLFMLHVYLWSRRITTYEWIMERRNAAKVKEEAIAKEQERLLELAKQKQVNPVGGGTVMMVQQSTLIQVTGTAPVRGQPMSFPIETPRGDEEGRHTQNLNGEKDPYPEYLNSLRNSANQRRLLETAESGDQLYAQHATCETPNGNQQQDTLDVTMFQRNITVTAAGVQLNSTTAAGLPVRPVSANLSAVRSGSRTPSRSESPTHDATISRNPSNNNMTTTTTATADQTTLGRHGIRAQRPMSGSNQLLQPLATATSFTTVTATQVVTMHMQAPIGSGGARRESYSRSRNSNQPLVRGSPELKPSPTDRQLSTETGGRRELPPIRQVSLSNKGSGMTGNSTYTAVSQSEPSSSQSNLVSPSRPLNLPGSVSEVSPTSKIADAPNMNRMSNSIGLPVASGLVSPSNVAFHASPSPSLSPSPMTPTSTQLFQSGPPPGAITLPPPTALITASPVNQSNSARRRDMEEEVNSFLADRHSTELNFKR